MAAYAAVVSLMNTMDAVMNHPRLSSSFDKEQIESLGEKLGVLLEFIENYSSHGGDEEAECLESKISSAAHTAEDVIESHIVDQIHAGVLEKTPCFFIDLHQILQGINHIKEEVVKVKEKKESNDDQQRKYSTPAASSEPLTTGKATMVGFDGYLNQLLDGLIGLESRRQVIPIVGMGGIGKTTLARNAYENLLTVQHFDVRAWASISQQYNVRKILIELNSCLRDTDEKLEEKTDDQLSERLYKILCGRRYLIILDDMWSITAWDKIKFCFPEDSNSSRIIVTSRLLQVANDFGSSRAFVMDLLDDDKSWNLFCDKAFTKEGFCCPAELEQIGKAIVKKCKGLPLSIVVIGALLGKTSRKKEYWENIVEDISFILNSAEDILSLSYNHLPARLKPCFLYLGIFPEDHEIHVSRLIKLWIAEGFIKPDKDQSLEEVAEGYINDLFSRNLILVASLGWNRKRETFYIHDLLRDLCLRVAEKEKFFCVTKTVDQTPESIDRERRIVIRGGITEVYHDQAFHTLKSKSMARSLICEWGQPLIECRLLRVLVADYKDDKSYCPDVAFQQVNMRLLAYEWAHLKVDFVHTIVKSPQSMSLLWNLQTMIFSYDAQLEAPVEIWKLRQLRHLEFWSISIPDPPSSDDEEDDELVLHNLETLMTVEDFSCSEEVCKRIPNIKRLHLCYHDLSEELYEENTNYCLQNIGCLNKLESVSYEFVQAPDYDHLLQKLKFPNSLKELCLKECRLDWNEMIIIGSLPNLEVLKLHSDSFVGSEWDPVDGEFLGLKYLAIGCYRLKKWNADSSHFPVLDTLVLHHLFHLDEIPSGIGDIPTLRVIRVDDCSISVAISAMKILEEQESLGNDGLHIQVQFWEKRKLEEFMKQVEVERIICSNFKLSN